ncbi:MAG: HugZ family protein [Planctomycetota bacterium]
MAEDPVAAARALLERERSAVLCTLHADLDGWPFGSVVPYAVLPDGDVVVFVSDIAEHTKNLQRHPRASLFVADPTAAAQPQAGARLTLLVRASRPDGADAAAAEACYFARFPDAAAMRQAHGFATWRLAVDRVRWIAGFGSMGWIERGGWIGASDPNR